MARVQNEVRESASSYDGSRAGRFGSFADASNIGSTNQPAFLAGGVIGAQGVTPINQTLGGGERVGWLASAPAGKLVGFDRRLSIERVFEIGSNIQEQENDVVSQINKLVLTEVEGYAIIDPKANKTLTLTA